MIEGKDKYLIVIVGPTAVGKTDLCVKLAKHFQTEIVSADSRQFYKEMAIGTAKPTPEEMDGVKHHFVDSHSIQDEISAGHFEREAIATIAHLHERFPAVILTGGSGLYIRAVCEGMDELPQVDEMQRKQLNALARTEDGFRQLLDELERADPEYFAKVDKANTQRIVRAIEVIRASGKPFSFFFNQPKPPRPFKVIMVGLNRDREELYDRINRRMDLMLEGGLLDEAKALYEHRDRYALQTVGYKEIYDFLDGKTDWDECVRLLKQNSRRYAKRQITWFKKEAGIHWFHPDDYEGIVKWVSAQIGPRTLS